MDATDIKSYMGLFMTEEGIHTSQAIIGNTMEVGRLLYKMTRIISELEEEHPPLALAVQMIDMIEQKKKRGG